jgi:cytoskeletal protein CcmA (bactofilin family)
MTTENFNLNENSAYVGARVIFKGDIVAQDTVIVEGTVEGNVAAGSVRVGTNGAIKGSLSAADAEIKGLLAEKADIKGFLHLRSTGRIEGNISCGDLEVERGAVIAGAFTVGAPPAEPATAGIQDLHPRFSPAMADGPDGDDEAPAPAHDPIATNGAAAAAA